MLPIPPSNPSHVDTYSLFHLEETLAEVETQRNLRDAGRSNRSRVPAASQLLRKVAALARLLRLRLALRHSQGRTQPAETEARAVR